VGPGTPASPRRYGLTFSSHDRAGSGHLRQGFYAGKAAATLNTYGQGKVIYVGTESPSPVFYERLAAQAAQAASLKLGETLPEGVELAVRENGLRKSSS